MIDYLAQKIIKLYQKKYPQKQNFRSGIGSFAGWFGSIGNLLLFVLKLVLGLMINSISLLADAFHSVTDIFTSVILIISYKISNQPPDKEHPYGHQRAEYIASIIMGVIIAVAGIEFLLKSIRKIINPSIADIPPIILIFIAFTIFFKLFMGILVKKLGEKVSSGAVKADALHHFTDVWSSIMVFLAVGGAMFDLAVLDGIGGIFVGGLLIYASIDIIKDASDSILGNPPSHELIQQIRGVANETEGVLNVHDIIVHSYGIKSFISLHMETDERESLSAAHQIASKLEDNLLEKISAEITIHIDPVNAHNPIITKVDQILTKISQNSDKIRDYHELRIIKHSDKSFLQFDLVTSEKCKSEKKHQSLLKAIKSEIHQEYPDLEIRINCEPLYMY